MIWKLLLAIFSPEFERVLIEVWESRKQFQREQTSVAIDQAFEQAEKSANTEAIANEIGKLIK